jgi:hypothetical protein
MKPTAETSCTGAYVNICPALWVWNAKVSTTLK